MYVTKYIMLITWNCKLSIHKRTLKYFQQKVDKSRGFHINFSRRTMEAAESKES